jgi:hypothetical protein
MHTRAMERDRQGFLRQLEDRLSRVSSWLHTGRHASEQAAERDLHARVELLRREITRVRHAASDSAQGALASARASLDDMARDYDVQQPRTSFSRPELELLRRHLHRTGALLPHLSNLDDPRWTPAHEEYERSWDAVERAFETEGTDAIP